MAKEEGRAFTVAIVSLLFTEGFDGIAGMMFQPIVPLFLRDQGLTAFQTTLLALVPMLVGGAFTALNGKLSDKVGRKKVLLVNLMGETAAYVFMSRGYTVLSLAICFSFLGAFTSTDAVVQAYVMENTEEEFKARVLSAKTTIKALSSACGAGVGAALFAAGGWPCCCLSMAACSAMQLLVGAIFWSSRMPAETEGASDLENPSACESIESAAGEAGESSSTGICSLFSHFFHPDRGALLWVGVISIGAMMPPFMLLPFILQDKYHFDEASYSRFFGGFCLFMFLFTQLSEWQVKRFGAITCIFMGNVLTGSAVLWLVVAAPMGLRWAAYPMYAATTFLVAQNNGAQILLDNATPPAKRGEVFGIFGAMCALVAGAAGPGAAALYDMCWYVPFCLSLGCFAITMPLIPLIKDVKRPAEPLLPTEMQESTPKLGKQLSRKLSMLTDAVDFSPDSTIEQRVTPKFVRKITGQFTSSD